MPETTPPVDQAEIPVLSLATDRKALAHALGESFRTFGFAMVRDHGIDPRLIETGWALTEQFFALPEALKRSYHLESLAGARGYTPFGTEIARDAAVSDLKEFWHVGRERDLDDATGESMPANIWPDKPEGFRKTFTTLFAALDETGRRLLQCIAIDLGLDEDWFDPVVRGGNSVLRLLHYPALPDHTGGAIRAAPHEDINLITLLLGAEEAGLELLGKDGQWWSVAPPDGALVVNIGDMMQRLTNHVLPSTTHRVSNPAVDRIGSSRFSMPFFVHPRSDFLIETLPCCVGVENPDSYPVPITADAYLQIRLREIGLKK